MNGKIKLSIGVWGSQVLIQIHEMDQRFRANPDTPKQSFIASNGFSVFSASSPAINQLKDGYPRLSDSLHLWGGKSSVDNVQLSYNFASQEEAKIYVSRLKEALHDWSQNWEGFKEEPERRSPSMTCSNITEYDLGTVKYIVGHWGYYVLFQVLDCASVDEHVWDFTNARGLHLHFCNFKTANGIVDLIKISRDPEQDFNNTTGVDISAVVGEPEMFECNCEEAAIDYRDRLVITMKCWARCLKKEEEAELTSCLELFEV